MDLKYLNKKLKLSDWLEIYTETKEGKNLLNECKRLLTSVVLKPSKPLSESYWSDNLSKEYDYAQDIAPVAQASHKNYIFLQLLLNGIISFSPNANMSIVYEHIMFFVKHLCLSQLDDYIYFNDEFGGVSRFKRPPDEHILKNLEPLLFIAYRFSENKQIFQFSNEIVNALSSTELPENISLSLFEKLPFDCFYLGAGKLFDRHVLKGAYVITQTDFDGTPRGLRLDFVSDRTDRNEIATGTFIISTFVTLGEGKTLSDYMRDLYHLLEHEISYSTYDMERTVLYTKHVLNCLLYLASEKADIEKAGTKYSGKGFGNSKNINLSKNHPKHCQVNKVGYSVNYIKQLREVRKATESGATGKTVAPHIRRAHWHTYWVGKKDGSDRQQVVKWILPTLVNAKDESELKLRVNKVVE